MDLPTPAQDNQIPDNEPHKASKTNHGRRGKRDKGSITKHHGSTSNRQDDRGKIQASTKSKIIDKNKQNSTGQKTISKSSKDLKDVRDNASRQRDLSGHTQTHRDWLNNMVQGGSPSGPGRSPNVSSRTIQAVPLSSKEQDPIIDQSDRARRRCENGRTRAKKTSERHQHEEPPGQSVANMLHPSVPQFGFGGTSHVLSLIDNVTHPGSILIDKTVTIRPNVTSQGQSIQAYANSLGSSIAYATPGQHQAYDGIRPDRTSDGTDSTMVMSSGTVSTPQQHFQPSPISYIYVQGIPLPTLPSPEGVTVLREPILSTLNNFFGSMYMSAFQGLLLPQHALQEHGYSMSDLTIKELDEKRRCVGCGKFWGKIRKVQERAAQAAAKDQRRMNMKGALNDGSGTAAASQKQHETKESKKDEKVPVMNCKYHPGKIIKHWQQNKPGQSRRFDRLWSCCHGEPRAAPCCEVLHHVPEKLDLVALRNRYQMTATPAVWTPFQRAAVAIDCEMGLAETGDSELIRVTVIDYFTTEVLIDQLVFPDVAMTDLRTRFSGVSWAMLNQAAARGQCLRGRDAAREKVFQFVGPETIVVAHSGRNDLGALYWCHSRILDTHLTEDIPERARLQALKEQKSAAKAIKQAEADAKEDPKDSNPDIADDNDNMNEEVVLGKVDKPENEKIQQEKLKKVRGSGPFSLKTLTRKRLGRDIQTSGKQGHDSMEDALAARDLAHWLVRRVLEPDNPEFQVAKIYEAAETVAGNA